MWIKKEFAEKSKYRKMIPNIGQYRKIGSTKGVQNTPLQEYKKYDINCLVEQYHEGILCKCNMPLIFFEKSNANDKKLQVEQKE